MYALNSHLFNKIPNPLGQQKQKFPRVIYIIYMKISSAGTWASGSDYRLSYLFPPLPSSVGHDVCHESLSISVKDLTWGLQTGLSKGHRKA